jgi:hypothetical protein
MQYGRRRKQARIRFSIKSLFALVTFSAILVCALKWLFNSHWPLIPLLALIPPMVATFFLLSATQYETWKGTFIGALFAMCLILYRGEYIVLFDDWYETESTSNAIRLIVEFFCFWILFQFAGFPLVGCCVDAIRQRYVCLGARSLLATFVYYFGIFLTFIWIICRDFWK